MTFMLMRHGDLPITNITEIRGEKQEHKGSFVLALGEVSNHKHVITVEKPEDMQVFSIGNGMHIVELFGTATITHEEHAPLKLAPGRYKVGREREVDWFNKTTRQVVD